MGIESMLLVFAVGAALLALWTDERFPGLVPRDLRGAVIRLVAAFAIGYLAGPAVNFAVGAGIAPGFALVALVLPALAFIFLAALWTIRVLQGLLYGLRG